MPPYYAFDAMQAPKDFLRYNYLTLKIYFFHLSNNKSIMSSLIAVRTGPNQLTSSLHQSSNEKRRQTDLFVCKKLKESVPKEDECFLDIIKAK